MSADKCNADVFERGISMGLFAMTKQQAETYCKAETERTGHTHDWHFAAGRVHIKALLPQAAQQGGEVADA